MYVGHGVAPRTLYVNVMRAMVKKLFAKASVHIANWGDVIATSLNSIVQEFSRFRIKLKYRLSTSATDYTLITSDVDFVSGGTPTTATWDQVVTNLITALAGIPGSVVDQDELHFVEIALFQRNEVDDEELLMSLIPLEELMIDIKFVSYLTLQNRTNDAAGSTNILSTSNNPVHGKVYKSSKGWLNGFDMARTPLTTEANRLPLYTNITTGIIATNSEDTYTSMLQKPPQGWMLNTNKCSKIMMNPGQVKHSKIAFNAKMRFNTFAGKFQKFFTETAAAIGSAPARFEIGLAEVFGLESMLNDRSETTEYIS